MTPGVTASIQHSNGGLSTYNKRKINKGKGIRVRMEKKKTQTI
jgi:hypothetical protein